ncbi:SDR family oxidoreductase [Paenibacillus hodogayensis]|uniref:SDR family oxidoreductase n=1 Tax=Paenibacillus hodogayensis TaxID=279208 RepID=A0ABV5VYN8_9BACL
MSAEHTTHVLVFGAGGLQGGAVAAKLLEAGNTVKTVVRSEEKAERLRKAGLEAIAADLADLDGIRKAYEGVDRVFVTLPVEFNAAKLADYTRNIVEAAKEAKVKLLVANTSVRVPDDAGGVTALQVKRELIDTIRASGIPSIILEPTLYYENFHLPGVLSGNVLAYPVPADSPIAWIGIDEAAAYAVEALGRPELAGRTIPIGGPEALTGQELAERFTAALGRDIQFYSLPVPVFEQAVGSLLGAESGAGLAGLYAWIGDNASRLAEPGAGSELSSGGLTLSSWIKTQADNGAFAQANDSASE